MADSATRILYTYYRSSAAYRVRIALNLKGLAREDRFKHLRHGEHRAADYLALNPQGLLPAFVDGDLTISQSMAILEYLEEAYPDVPLLPPDIGGRARVRQLALLVACDIHPLNNLQVLNYLRDSHGADDSVRATWYRHWVVSGFTGLEALLADSTDTGEFCHGDRPTIADACLVPQVYNAERFKTDMSAFPTIARINASCLQIPAFSEAAPDAQADAE